MAFLQIKQNRKKSRLKHWLNQHVAYIFLISVFVIGFVLGMIVVSVIPANAEESKEATINSRSFESSNSLKEEEITKVLDDRDNEWTEFTATAYCSCEECCGEWANDRPIDESGNSIVYTASGKEAKEGVTIAADWSVLPPGTIVEILGCGVYEVQDKGGKITGEKIDIYFDRHDDALEWGRKQVLIRVLRLGGENHED